MILRYLIPLLTLTALPVWAQVSSEPPLRSAQQEAPISPGMKFPNRFAYEWIFSGGNEPLFRCDYTTRTCLRGRQFRNEFVGEVLADDRVTVLAHIACVGSNCTNFDTGVQLENGRVVGQLKFDFPSSCVEAARDHREICDLTPVAPGSRWGLQFNTYRCKQRYGQPGSNTDDCILSDSDEEVDVDKIDGAKVCVHTARCVQYRGKSSSAAKTCALSGAADPCYWVNKSNLIQTERIERESPGRPPGLPRGPDRDPWTGRQPDLQSYNNDGLRAAGRPGAGNPDETMKPRDLLPVQVGAFDKTFNDIAARSIGSSDLRAVPEGCKELIGSPKGLRQCNYKIGQSSIIRVVGRADDSNALGVELKFSKSSTDTEMLASSIVAMAEIAAPERSIADRTQIVRALLRDIERVKLTPPTLVCRDLGGRWQTVAASGRWALSGSEFDGELYIRIVKPLPGECPRGVQ